MDNAISLDVLHTLRQLGINPSKAMEFLSMEVLHLSASSESADGSVSLNEMD